MPGHSSILALSKPEVTTFCPGHAGYGLDRENLNPTNASTYEYIRKLYSDVLPRFPDSYVHLGGGAYRKDASVPPTCSQSLACYCNVSCLLSKALSQSANLFSLSLLLSLSLSLDR